MQSPFNKKKFKNEICKDHKVKSMYEVKMKKERKEEDMKESDS